MTTSGFGRSLSSSCRSLQNCSFSLCLRHPVCTTPPPTHKSSRISASVTARQCTLLRSQMCLLWHPVLLRQRLHPTVSWHQHPPFSMSNHVITHQLFPRGTEGHRQSQELLYDQVAPCYNYCSGFRKEGGLISQDQNWSSSHGSEPPKTIKDSRQWFMLCSCLK